MRQTMKKLAILLAAAGLSACLGRNESSIGAADDPLVVLLSPAHAAAESVLDSLARQLSSGSGLDVETRAADSPVDAIERLGTRQADAGLLTMEEFLLAHEEYEVAPALQVLRGKGETTYEGVILVKSKSTVRKPMDLDGARFGYVDPYSVSGFLLPARFLKKEGVKVAPVFLMTHARALKALDQGEVAAVATYAGQAAARKDLRVLARTGTIPNEPFVFRKGLRPEKREALLKALRGLASSPEGKKTLSALADIAGFGPVDQDAYRSVHKLLREAGKSVYDIVPEGVEVRRLNQPYMDAR